jgi:SAM-dependent methyltransferase
MAEQPHDWEIIASRDPFFGVIVSDEFRAKRIDADAKQRFYATGEADIAQVLTWFDADLGARPTEGEALDIGCGVGRLSYAIAKVMPKVTGYDVSESMLRVAREAAPANLSLVNELPSGPFAWINSYIVFQHIPPAEGIALLGACLDRAAPGAFTSVQITGWREGLRPRTLLENFRHWRNLRVHRQKGWPVDPLIQMHDYNFSDVMRCFMSRGFNRLVLRHTDHGHHHGAWVIARRD